MRHSIWYHTAPFVNPVLISLLPGKVIKKLSEPYVAGHSITECIAAIAEFYEKHGRYSSFDILGEEAASKEEADRNSKAYFEAIDKIHTRFPHKKIASISVKPSAITHDKNLLNERLESIVAHAQGREIDVTLDMESHEWTEASIAAAKHVWTKGYRNFGIVLQSRLDRTQNDVERLLNRRNRIRVRACIGTYHESKKATNNKREAKERLFRMIKNLFGARAFVEIATHDTELIDRIIKRIIEPGVKSGLIKNNFEFQFLKGVKNAYKIEKKLMEKGYRVRYYMPAEMRKGDGILYMKRRLASNPDLLRSWIRNALQRHA